MAAVEHSYFIVMWRRRTDLLYSFDFKPRLKLSISNVVLQLIIVEVLSGKPKCNLSEGIGNEWEAPIWSGKWGSGAEPLKIVRSMPLDCKKTPLFEH